MVDKEKKEKIRMIIMKFVVKVTKFKSRVMKDGLVELDDPVVETKTLNKVVRDLMKL